MIKYIFSFFLLSFSLQFNYLTYKKTDDIKQLLIFDPVELGDEYKEDLDLIDKVKEDEKKTTCMILVRNNIFYVNEDLKQILKSTKFNKADVFDRAILDMYNTCILKITQKIVNDFFLTNNPKVLDTTDVGIDFSFNSDKLINSKPIFAPYEKELIKMLYGEEQNTYEEEEEKKEKKEKVKEEKLVEPEKIEEKKTEQIKKDNDYIEKITEQAKVMPEENSFIISYGKMKYILYGFFFGIIFALFLIYIFGLLKGKNEKEIKDKKIKKN
jgi:Fe2+ transport system protein B